MRICKIQKIKVKHHKGIHEIGTVSDSGEIFSEIIIFILI